MNEKIPLEEIVSVDRLCRQLEITQAERPVHPVQIDTLAVYAWRPSIAEPGHRRHLGWSPGGATPCTQCLRQIEMFRQLGHPPTSVIVAADLAAEDRAELDAHCDNCKQCTARRRMEGLADVVRRAPERLAAMVDKMAEWVSLDAPELVRAFDEGGGPPTRPWTQVDESPFRVEVHSKEANILFVGIRGPQLTSNVKLLYVALVREDLVLETRVKWRPCGDEFQARAYFPNAAVMSKRGAVTIMFAPLPDEDNVS